MSTWSALRGVFSLAAVVGLVPVCGELIPDVTPTLEFRGTSWVEALSGGEWALGGAATAVDNVVRLTMDGQQGRRGWFERVVPLTNVGNEWEINVQFKLWGKSVSLYGDGMAIWYTADPITPGAVFGHSALFKGLGVFFDTYDNDAGRHTHKHPWISAVVSDGTRDFDLNSHTGTHMNEGCHNRLRSFAGNDDKITTVRLSYRGRVLSVKLSSGRLWDYKQKNTYEWVECLQLRDVDLPPGYFLGVSASTGDLTDNHDLHAMTVRGTMGATIADVPREVVEGWRRQRQLSSKMEELVSEYNAVTKGAAPPAGASSNPPTDTEATAQPNSVPPSAPNVAAAPAAVGVGGSPAPPRTGLNPVAEKQPPGSATPVPTPSAPPAVPTPAPFATGPRAVEQAAVQPTPWPTMTPEERVRALEELLGKSVSFQAAVTSARGLADQVKEIHDTLNTRIAGLHSALETALDTVRRQEEVHDKKLAALEAALQGRVDTLSLESAGAAKAWVTPFWILAGCVVVLLALAYRKYRALMKRHLL